MEDIALIIIVIIFMIPVYALLIWTYLEPEESFLFGQRWMFKGEPEPSQKMIKYSRFSSLTSMIGLPVVFISFVLDYPLLRLSLVIFFLVIIIGAFKIFSDES